MLNLVSVLQCHSSDFSTFCADSYKEDEGERRELITWITSPEVAFGDRILLNLAEYRHRVQPRVAATRPADVMHTTFEGRYSHLDRLSIPLNFILFVTTAANSLVPENLGYYWYARAAHSWLLACNTNNA